MFKSILFASALVLAGSACAAETAPNTLSPTETRDGWRLLWDGHSLAGWHGVKPERVNDRWTITDGILSVKKSSGEPGPGTDLVSDQKFSDFELIAEFKVTPGANSGIKTFVSTQKTGVVGLEYQIIDDALHPDAKLGKDGDRTLASLYDLYPAAKSKKAKPVGEWNIARIISRGTHVEHWLNGEKVTEYDRGSEDFRKRVAESKFKSFPNFGELAEGPLLLQDHGDEVSFRSIKLRVLPPKS
jgi:Domain of Unknown Function (DUF1080)